MYDESTFLMTLYISLTILINFKSLFDLIDYDKKNTKEKHFFACVWIEKKKKRERRLY